MMSNRIVFGLKFATKVAIATARMAALVVPSSAQSTVAASPSFEVATVKPTNPDQRGLHQLDCSSGAGFAAREQTLLILIEWAFDLPHGTSRVLGGPKWMDSPGSTFDVHGKVERKVSFVECRLMVQSLLADRFKVASHWETRELPVYVLSVGRKGSKLHEADNDPEVQSRVTLNGGEIQLRDGYSTTGSGRGMSMRELARYLSAQPVVGRPVIDKTGLAGFYGFSLNYASTLSDDSRPHIFAALQDQLGLKLEATKGPVEILVIDHAEKPSEN
jgi:uncharacterized protein (TIGR03435 family)